MLSIERDHYTTNELERCAKIMREGMLFVIRNFSTRTGRLALGNPKFSEEFVGRIVQLCASYTTLSDAEALYAAIIKEADSKPVSSGGDRRYFQSFWLSAAKREIRTVREGACPETDTSLFISIPGVSDCLESFAVYQHFNERKFVKVLDPIQVEGQEVKLIPACPAMGIVRTWSEAYTLSRRIAAITHPELIPSPVD